VLSEKPVLAFWENCLFLHQITTHEKITTAYCINFHDVICI
jgi:hypothetical protein